MGPTDGTDTDSANLHIVPEEGLCNNIRCICKLFHQHEVTTNITAHNTMSHTRKIGNCLKVKKFSNLITYIHVDWSTHI